MNRILTDFQHQLTLLVDNQYDKHVHHHLQDESLAPHLQEYCHIMHISML